eukprot:g68882.t1
MIGAEGVSPVSCASCWFICRQLADLDGSSASPQAGVIRATVDSTSELCSALEEDLDLPSNCATEREPQECGVWFDRWSLPRGGDGWVSVGLVRRGGVLRVRRYASVAWSPGGGLLRGWALFCHSSSFLPIPSLSDAGALRVSPTVPLLLTEPWWSSPQYGATSSDGATLFLPEMQPSRAYFGRAYPYGRLPIEALLATPLSRTNLVGSDIPRKSGVLDKGVSILPKFLMLAPVPLTGLVFGGGARVCPVPRSSHPDRPLLLRRSGPSTVDSVQQICRVSNLASTTSTSEKHLPVRNDPNKDAYAEAAIKGNKTRNKNHLHRWRMSP